MIPFIIFTVIISTAFYIYQKNKIDNRREDRSNRLTKKQEALIALLKENKNKEDEN
jgi:hypothetical protein